LKENTEGSGWDPAQSGTRDHRKRVAKNRRRTPTDKRDRGIKGKLLSSPLFQTVRKAPLHASTVGKYLLENRVH